MKLSAQNKRSNKYLLLTYILLIVVLFLSVLNLNSYYSRQFVLGAETEDTKPDYSKETDYWLSFLESHPTYIEGWIRLGDIEKVNGDLNKASYYYDQASKIDPNWVIR